MTEQSGQRLSGTVSVLDTLRGAIVRGELHPGERLVENDLARRYGTSRGAVREALVLLDNEGLVSRERNRGASVRPVSLEEAIEITEVRAALEGLCAARAAGAATRAERAGLRAIGRDMAAAVEAGDVLGYSATNQRVHARIRELAAQHTVAAILDRLRFQSVRYQFQVALLPGRPGQGLREHLAVIEAVAAGNADAAEQAMRAHLQSVIGVLRTLAAGAPPAVPVVPVAVG
ncbi:GntR family transcriptional regulator [Geodermatophilus sabuli]|uniref:GntR family transcriptional regulator n=1 Tax=Geodermatophilus sabuli TaxID=1564158 RepID=UPI0031F2D7E9